MSKSIELGYTVSVINNSVRKYLTWYEEYPSTTDEVKIISAKDLYSAIKGMQDLFPNRSVLLMKVYGTQVFYDKNELLKTEALRKVKNFLSKEEFAVLGLSEPEQC